MSIQNVGNTCYLSTALQCLFHTNILDRFVKITNVSKQTHKPFVYEYIELHSRVRIHDELSADPSAFYEHVRNLYPFFDNSEQHDAHEAMQVILDLLSTQTHPLSTTTFEHTDNLPALKSWSIKQFNIVDEIFKVQFQTNITCSHCKYQIINYQCEYGLFTTDLYNLKQTIDLPGYVCDNCTSVDRCYKHVCIYHFPPCLLLYAEDSQTTQTESMNLELSDQLLIDSDKEYGLYAVCNHHPFLNGGHYTSFVKKDSDWCFKDDDSSISIVGEFQENSALILNGARIFLYELKN